MAFWESGPTFGFCHHKIDGELRKDDHLAKVFSARRFHEQEIVIFPGLLWHYKVCVALVSIFHDLTLVVAIF